MDVLHAELQRDVGRLEATVKTQGDRLLAMDKKLDRVLLHVEREKATKRTLLTMGSVVGSIVGGAVATAVSWWTGGR